MQNEYLGLTEEAAKLSEVLAEICYIADPSVRLPDSHENFQTVQYLYGIMNNFRIPTKYKLVRYLPLAYLTNSNYKTLVHVLGPVSIRDFAKEIYEGLKDDGCVIKVATKYGLDINLKCIVSSLYVGGLLARLIDIYYDEFNGNLDLLNQRLKDSGRLDSLIPFSSIVMWTPNLGLIKVDDYWDKVQQVPDKDRKFALGLETQYDGYLIELVDGYLNISSGIGRCILREFNPGIFHSVKSSNPIMDLER